MFYLKKATREDEFRLEERVILLADFPAIHLRAGMIATVVEIYRTGDHGYETGGVMIEYESEGGVKWREGFGREELQYLAMETQRRPDRM